MRVLVCGGRGFNSYGMMCLALDRLNAELGFGVLIDGGAAGADMLANAWAQSRMVTWERYPVDEALDGPWPAAGCRRNTRMLAAGRPDVGVCFPGGGGTGDMRKKMLDAGLRVYDVNAAGQYGAVERGSGPLTRLWGEGS